MVFLFVTMQTQNGTNGGKLMKKKLALLIILIAFVLSACAAGNGNGIEYSPPPTEPPPPTTPIEITQPTEPPIYISPTNDAVQTRYLHNQNIMHALDGGFIFGQNHETVRDMRIGSRGNLGMHGCGPVAVHNLLLYLYQNHPTLQTAPPHIAGIIRFLDENNGINLNGLAGTHPEVITDYLQHAGHPALLTYEPTEIDTRVRESTVSILLYGQLRGNTFVHYVMIRYEAEQFWIYNEFGNDTQPRVYDSLDAWVVQGGYRVVAVITI